ncbi:MAG: guanylate kinase [Eubacteriales bacterium]|nr:guanylate kinase [Eubacteriales bacterium]
MNKGLLVILSGFSGSGKGTIMKRLMEKYDNYVLSVSATTRQPRTGEVDGVHYFFKTQEEFDQMIKEDAFLEYAGYVNHSYGTPKAYVEENLNAGRDVILEIEMQGALQVKRNRPDTLMVFVTPPTAAELEKRLRGRGTETEDVIQQRLQRAVVEAEYMQLYDYILVNDEVEACVDELHSLIQAQHKQVGNQKEFIEDICRQLNKREEK